MEWLVEQLRESLDQYAQDVAKRNELAAKIQNKQMKLGELFNKEQELNQSFEPDAKESEKLVRKDIDAIRMEIEEIKELFILQQKIVAGFESVVNVCSQKIADLRQSHFRTVTLPPPPPPPPKLPCAIKTLPDQPHKKLKKSIDDDLEEEDDDASTTESDSEVSIKPTVKRFYTSSGIMCRIPGVIEHFLRSNRQKLIEFLPPNPITGDEVWKCDVTERGTYTPTTEQYNKLNFPGIRGFKASETGGKQRFFMDISGVRVDHHMGDLMSKFTFEDPRDCKEVLFKIVQLYKVWCEENGHQPTTKGKRVLTEYEKDMQQREYEKHQKQGLFFKN
jgi:hypothetical protein